MAFPHPCYQMYWHLSRHRRYSSPFSIGGVRSWPQHRRSTLISHIRSQAVLPPRSSRWRRRRCTCARAAAAIANRNRTRGIAHGLFLLVFGLKLSLHIEVELAFTLDSLLFDVADYALMHGLVNFRIVSLTTRRDDRNRAIKIICGGRKHTCFSFFCCQWTNTTVRPAKSEVPMRVSLAGRDMFGS